MRFAIFSSLIPRSSAARSSLQGLIALSALVVLTGAKGQGCGGVDEPSPPPEPNCGPGFHWETVCSPCEIGEMCEEQCVPDSVCPADWSEQTICSGGTTSSGQGGFAGGTAMPVDPGECWTECIPPQPYCPPGTIEQTVCGGSVTVGVGGSGGSGGWGSASSAVGVGGSGPGGIPMPSEPCWTECVPVEPYCPPGTTPQTFCDEGTTVTSSSVGVGGSGGWAGTGGAGGSGGWAGTGGGTAGGGIGGSDSDFAAPRPPGGGCWTECVPTAPYCPPGTTPQTYCDGGTTVTSSSVGVGGSGGWAGTGGAGGNTAGADPGFAAPLPPGGGCWTECVPTEPYCPPNSIPQTVCGGSAVSVGSTGTGYGGAGGASPYPGQEYCWTECVPVEPYCPPGTTQQTICEGGTPETSSSGTGVGGMPYPGGGCWTDCVPTEPYCPPDSIPQTVCGGSSVSVGSSGSTGTGVGGMPYPGDCWTECVPVEPYCPPGMIEQKVCSGESSSSSTGTGMGGADAYPPGDCWIECVEGATCPPGATIRTICEEISAGGSAPICRTECVLMLP
ncbi:hypothetical protein [Sorangium sp. So ce124]|uniref:hypothetical protein n=1 Tax=Sorangium sp. So ce124 TaxID=3133280 RepID=UPI003F62973B